MPGSHWYPGPAWLPSLNTKHGCRLSALSSQTLTLPSKLTSLLIFETLVTLNCCSPHQKPKLSLPVVWWALATGALCPETACSHPLSALLPSMTCYSGLD